MTVCSLCPHIREWPGTSEAGRGGGREREDTLQRNTTGGSERGETSQAKFCKLELKHCLFLRARGARLTGYFC